jgi:hypothetical protein
LKFVIHLSDVGGIDHDVSLMLVSKNVASYNKLPVCGD